MKRAVDPYEFHYPYFGQEDPQVAVAGMIADEDKSAYYELEACAVFETTDPAHPYLVVYVRSCSCWPYLGSTQQTVCVDKLAAQNAMPDNFRADLLAACQAANWKVSPEEKS